MKRLTYLCAKNRDNKHNGNTRKHHTTMNGIEKMDKIMQSEKLNKKHFADRVGISQSTISNIYNGRNNVSLEVMQKILNAFRTISSDWLILDSGPMYRPKGSEAVQDTLFDIRPIEPETATAAIVPVTSDNRAATGEQLPIPVSVTTSTAKNRKNSNDTVKADRRVNKIIIYYTDGTFEER